MKSRIILIATILFSIIAIMATTGYAATYTTSSKNNTEVAQTENIRATTGISETVRVSVASDGAQGDGWSGNGGTVISNDGRYVVFTSRSSNLVVNDTNGVDDVFVHDTETDTTTRVSVASDGTQGNGASSVADISADGRYILFTSSADNLVPGDNNGLSDAFVHDQVISQTYGISMDPGSTQLDGISGVTPAISADGQYIVYARGIWPYHYIYVRDWQSQTTQSLGYPVLLDLDISANGRYIAFDSRDDILPEDNNYEDDVYVYDRDMGNLTLASVTSSGIIGNDDSQDGVSISGDGRYVVFMSYATNLTGEPAIDFDKDVIVRDRQTGTTISISQPQQTVGQHSESSISDDGRYVAFYSTASYLVITDTNGVGDVFIHDLQTSETSLVSLAANGEQGNDSSGGASLSTHARYVAFVSQADNLVLSDTNGLPDIFVRNPGLAEMGEFSISGQVRDDTGSPIPGATILNSVGLIETSDENGNYSFTGLVTGTYTLTASFPGYNFLHSWTVTVPPNRAGIDFIGFIEDYAIMGQTRSEHNSPLSDVTITTNTGLTTTSDLYGNYSFTGLVTGTYTLTASLSGYNFLHSWTVTVPPNHIDIDFIGYFDDFIDISFRPHPDGYNFVNPGGDYPSNPTRFDPDYSKNELIEMFGEEAACWNIIDLVCILRPAARRWLSDTNGLMNKGHCEGLAVTSLRFFKGLDNPSDFQEDANSTYDLDWEHTRHHIAYYFVKQMTDPVMSYKSDIVQRTPAEIIMMLQQAMINDASDPTTLIVRQAGEGGHAITPYAVEDQGNGLYWIWVYDNNHPNDANRHVIVDTTANTWSYNLGGTIWSGDADTHTLGAVPISLYEQQSICPAWCEEETGTLISSPPTGTIQYQGGGHLLITNASNQRIGYDGNQFVNEMPNARAFQIDTGRGIPTEPIYSVPLNEQYSILLDGQVLTQTTTGSITQFGPGYATFVDDIAIDPTSSAQLFVTSDGMQASFETELDNEIQLGFAWDTPEAGYQLSAQNLEISADYPITLTVDRTNDQLVYENKQETNSEYDFSISRLTITGEQLFLGIDISAEGGDTHYIQYGDWDGTGPLTIEVDHGNDGTIDEIIQVQNKIPTAQIYLPIILR